MFASLSTLNAETLMDTLALIFKGKACAQLMYFCLEMLIKSVLS